MIVLDQTITAAIGIFALLLGKFLNGKIGFLSRVCIPDPVTGGLIVSLLTLFLKVFAGIEFTFDPSIQNICMLMFFTSVGFQCDLSAIKKGGKPLLILIALVAVLILLQNSVAIGIASAVGLKPIMGMVAGSIPMCGGHGTAAGFAELLGKSGVENAASLTMATATFGLVAGSLLGGPVAEAIIRRKRLTPDSDSIKNIETVLKTVKKKEEVSEAERMHRFTLATFEILIAMGLGSLLSKLLALTGISFPSYFGALICAIIIRNTTDFVPGLCTHPEETTKIGSLCLSLFLGMAMCSLRLWELAGLALPLCLMLASQIILMFLFSRFLAFPLLGGNYDAAVLVGGFCGFGLGATPNAMANMSAICNKHGYSHLPFIIVPIVGAAALDIINISVITMFVNLF